MLTVAAPSGSGGTRAAITDGGGGGDMLRASSRRYLDGSWIPVKTLAIQIRVFCAANRPGDAGRAGRGDS